MYFKKIRGKPGIYALLTWLFSRTNVGHAHPKAAKFFSSVHRYLV